jgi:uncharacterized protein YlxW (UPF0749 family)
MVEKEGVRFWTGFGLAVAGLPFYLSAAWWNTLKPKLDNTFLRTLNGVATDARWWAGFLFLVLAGLIFVPALETWIEMPLLKAQKATLLESLQKAKAERDEARHERDQLNEEVRNSRAAPMPTRRP